MKAWVYILKSNKGKFYIGSTDNLKRRIKQHKAGHTQTTKSMEAFELVLSQEYDSLNTARKIERKIKLLKRKDYIHKIITDGYIRLKV